ncbi:hypothetical protein S245_009961 [Arachis hypogaea]|nr:uncharacterized protein DS421_3g93790 [Arachis hypogaea]
MRNTERRKKAKPREEEEGKEREKSALASWSPSHASPPSCHHQSEPCEGESCRYGKRDGGEDVASSVVPGRCQARRRRRHRRHYRTLAVAIAIDAVAEKEEGCANKRGRRKLRSRCRC